MANSAVVFCVLDPALGKVVVHINGNCCPGSVIQISEPEYHPQIAFRNIIDKSIHSINCFLKFVFQEYAASLLVF